MEIVFFAHGAGLLNSQSMPRYASMLADGMADRGHTVQIWAPKPRFVRLPFPNSIKKWMGYIDQYVVFPQEVKRRLRDCTKNTLFVVTDQALGPWVPLVARLPHVIHCHDFLAQRSSLGEIPENVIGWTGQQYQRFIRNGYSKGENFISISRKTRDDLHRFLGFVPACSEVVYNGLNQSFKPMDRALTGTLLSKKFNIDLSGGFILHVGGNQWYKNRIGIVEIYTAWRSGTKLSIPLLLVGQKPSADLLSAQSQSSFKNDIHFISGVEDEYLRMVYAAASVFLFPSFAEGFGWPVAEAMASGCPVIVTNEAPMTEVAGNAGYQISRRPHDARAAVDWAVESAAVLEQVLSFSPAQREIEIEKGLANAKRFDSQQVLDEVELIYSNIVGENKSQPAVRVTSKSFPG